ncbi:hypothetical protein [Bradyrhizobium sp. SZCCHNS1012]|uniref:hypothetical protein n=1 Tax=Bradyrhizobium sp. SZCCHNS1012 TaxID=3057297 RepID=UPI002916C931|nr:hypothetical protein [Bradyrhizobium sp. SZCCHNS1012]
MADLVPYPYPVGYRVEGSHLGMHFSGIITEHRGPYSVVIDDRLVTPISLIERAEPTTAPAPPAPPDREQFTLL